MTAGGRRGRFATSVKNEMRSRLGEQRGDQRKCVEKAPLIGVVLDADERQPALVRDPHQLPDAIQRIRVGDDRDPDLGRSCVGHE